MGKLISDPRLLLWLVGTSAGAVAVGLVVHTLAAALIRHTLPRHPGAPGRIAMSRLSAPFRILLPLLALTVILPLAGVPRPVETVLDKPISILFVAALAWLVTRGLVAAEDILLARYNMDAEDNLAARKMRTQIDMIRRVLAFLVMVVAFAGVLMMFARVRQLGTSLLASAGVAGVILGFAAQRSLANLLAGLQVAITQPLRIDDVVVVEGEWGRIEEITLTYVVVKIWDERRLVLPISYFIEKPFQNWTRVSAELLGTVFVYVDYSVPVDAVRGELHRLLQASPLWDQRVWGLQVTNADERTMELRALMSAQDSPTAWNLRCTIREQLIAFIQKEFPGSLPRLRAELDSAARAPVRAPGAE